MNIHQNIDWTRLENVSNIYPATWNRKDPKVFRISCELIEPIKASILQQALDQTIEEIPIYKSVMRKSLFWYYLEKSDIKPVVRLESNMVLAPIYIGRSDDLLFRVSFHSTRISLEVFHALSDGIGALYFLQTLVSRYLTCTNISKYETVAVINAIGAVSGLMDDSYKKHFSGRNCKENGTLFKGIKAHQIRGDRFPDDIFNTLEGSMSATKVLDIASKNSATLTAFLASLYILVISKEMKMRKKEYPIVLTLPVNLRQYYESVTVRNIFCFASIGCDVLSIHNGIETITEVISDKFKKALTLDQLAYQTNKYLAIEQSFVARILPLTIKDLISRLIVNLSRRETTSMISNLGKITMPPELEPYIRQFSFCTSDVRPQLTFCSFGDRLVISISSPYQETDIQRTFYRLLSDFGIEIELSANISP